VAHIVVVGLMASGKTTVGRGVAEALGLPFHDSDAELLIRSGRTARDIELANGIDILHAIERQILLEDLAGPPSVIAAAASVIDHDDVLAILTDPEIAVVWLRISPAVSESREHIGDGRPSPEPLSAQARRRDPRFASVAGIVVDADRETPDSIVRTVLDRLADGDVGRPAGR